MTPPELHERVVISVPCYTRPRTFSRCRCGAGRTSAPSGS